MMTSVAAGVMASARVNSTRCVHRKGLALVGRSGTLLNRSASHVSGCRVVALPHAWCASSHLKGIVSGSSPQEWTIH